MSQTTFASPRPEGAPIEDLLREVADTATTRIEAPWSISSRRLLGRSRVNGVWNLWSYRLDGTVAVENLGPIGDGVWTLGENATALRVVPYEDQVDTLVFDCPQCELGECSEEHPYPEAWPIGSITLAEMIEGELWVGCTEGGVAELWRLGASTNKDVYADRVAVGPPNWEIAGFSAVTYEVVWRSQLGQLSLGSQRSKPPLGKRARYVPLEGQGVYCLSEGLVYYLGRGSCKWARVALDVEFDEIDILLDGGGDWALGVANAGANSILFWVRGAEAGVLETLHGTVSRATRGGRWGGPTISWSALDGSYGVGRIQTAHGALEVLVENRADKEVRTTHGRVDGIFLSRRSLRLKRLVWRFFSTAARGNVFTTKPLSKSMISSEMGGSALELIMRVPRDMGIGS